MKNMEALGVYDQDGDYTGYFLIEEEEMCKEFCEFYNCTYKREKLFK